MSNQTGVPIELLEKVASQRGRKLSRVERAVRRFVSQVHAVEGGTDRLTIEGVRGDFAEAFWALVQAAVDDLGASPSAGVLPGKVAQHALDFPIGQDIYS